MRAHIFTHLTENASYNIERDEHEVQKGTEQLTTHRYPNCKERIYVTAMRKTMRATSKTQ